MKEYIIYNTKNKFKYEEVKLLVKVCGINLQYRNEDIKELQSSDFNQIIKHKLIEGFKRFGRPIIVDHTGLFIEALNGMPGPLTQLFWDKLKGDKICQIVTNLKNSKAIAKTIIGYCDGKKIHTFSGELEGEIACKPHGGIEFQWGTIFIPKNLSKTYSELSIDEVNKFSHRSIAFKKFIDFYNNI